MKSFRRIFRFITPVSLALLLASCATVSQRVPSVHITNTKSVSIFPAAYDAVAVDGAFLFTGAFGDRSFSCQAYVVCDAEGIFMQAFSDFGTTLLTINCDSEGHVTASSDMMPQMFARYVVMDAQLAYYDFNVLRDALADASLTLTEEREGGSVVRRVFNRVDLVSEFTVDEATGSLTVKNSLRNYEYSLTALANG